MAERCLGDWLENDDYLSKVLRYLVDDGLHECSRVCRRWRELSFGVCPKLARVPSSRMTEMLSKYPNTVSMAVNVEDTNEDINRYLDAVKRFPKIEHLFWQGFSRMSSYRSLLESIAVAFRLAVIFELLRTNLDGAGPQTSHKPDVSPIEST